MARSSLTVPGFRAAGVRAGIRKKKDTRPDLGLVVCDKPAVAAGVFTKNRVRAAPVKLAQRRLKNGHAQAVLVNSGIANAMTGEEGMDAALTTTALAAESSGIPAELIIPASTGVIGIPLPVTNFMLAIPELVSNLSPRGFSAFSEAILTTDTVPKVASASFRMGKRMAVILGVAKGSGMIAPNMATMLGFVFTNVAVSAPFLKKTLAETADATFNRITVDGDTSTNDSLVAMAGGALGNRPLTASNRFGKSFSSGMMDVCSELSEKLVRDAEGATRMARIVVKGASSNSDALKIARAIAESPLVKTALHGADPNWGRVAAAAGRSGAKVDQKKLIIKIGGVICVRNGVPVADFDEKRMKSIMKRDTVEFEVDMGMGTCSACFLTCDFSRDYIKINSHYRT